MDKNLLSDTASNNFKLPRAVRTKPRNESTSQAEHETEYAVSPNTPLLSTEVQENAWVCGDNGKGQLGAPGSAAVLAPLPIQVVGRWAAISISDGHSAGLSCDSQLYCWGSNNKKQLGLGDKTPGVVDTPVLVSALSEQDVNTASDSYDRCVTLDLAGVVVGAHAAMSTAQGSQHTVCITTKDVISWGSNEYGQLGHGDQAPDICS
eukprot:gene2567-2869_t